MEKKVTNTPKVTTEYIEYENFFVEENFYHDIYDYICSFEADDMLIEDLPDNWTETLCLSDLEPIVQLDAESITDYVDDERFDEHDVILDNLTDTLNKYIDFDELNINIHKYHYKNDKFVVINKDYLLNFDENKLL